MKKTFLLFAALCCMAVANATVYWVDFSNPDVEPMEPPYQGDSVIFVQEAYLKRFQALYPDATFISHLEFACGKTADDNVTAHLDLAQEVAEEVDVYGHKTTIILNKMVLRFHGQGKIKDFDQIDPTVGGGTYVDWKDWSSFINEVIFEAGITHIGTNLLRDISGAMDDYQRPAFEIILPATLETFSYTFLPDDYAGEIYSPRPIPPQVSDWVAGTTLPDYILNAYVYVPDVYVDVDKSVTLYLLDDFWKNFTVDRVNALDMIAPVVPQDLIYDNQATIIFDAIANAADYLITITGENFQRVLRVYLDADNQWRFDDETPANTGGKPRRYLPIIRRDTVKGTVETAQIDITDLPAGKQLNYTIQARNESKVTISQKSGSFTTTKDKGVPTGIDEIVADEQIFDNRYYNILGQPVAPDYRGIIIHNGKKILRD